MTGAPRIAYSPRPDAMPEAELSALSVVYGFILDCHAKKEGGPAAAPDAAIVKNTEEVSHVSNDPMNHQELSITRSRKRTQ